MEIAIAIVVLSTMSLLALIVSIPVYLIKGARKSSKKVTREKKQETKTKEEIEEKSNSIKYEIEYNTTNPKKIYEVSEEEIVFFDKVYDEIGKGIKLRRMADGTLSVYYYSYPIGKIKLQGDIHYMQILKGLNGVKKIDGNIDDFILHIADWKRYIKWLSK